MTVPEVAKLLGISKQSAYNAVARGEIAVLRIGKRFLVPRAAMERVLRGESLDDAA